MPVMDGLAATREIRRYEVEHDLLPTTIIALTGASSINAKESALQSGVDKFMTKPVPLATLKGLLDDCKPHLSLGGT